MSFLSKFSSFFTAEQQQTELYQLWSMIGVNMEKAILEEQNRLNGEMCDISHFSESMYRSWLSFFLTQIPYRTTARCMVTTTFNKNYGTVTIPEGAQLSSEDGKKYVTLKEQKINTSTHTVTSKVEAIQGTWSTETGIYNGIIKVRCNNPDLSFIKLSLNGNDIPPCSIIKSYDSTSFMGFMSSSTDAIYDSNGIRGQFYLVIEDFNLTIPDTGRIIELSEGDVLLYDGNEWNRSIYVSELYSIQSASTFAIPRNGYYAYYQDGYLYIMIYPGNEIANPIGLSYTLRWIESEGSSGFIGLNTLSYDDKTFEHTDTSVAIENEELEMDVTNTASVGGIDQPTRGKLGLMLQQKLFSAVTISSIPEYTSWFLAQPEIGDCLVLGDYEKWLRTEKTEYTQTGAVQVYAVDTNGNNLTEDVKDTLLERIEPYKDIARIVFANFEPVNDMLVFTYTNCTDDTQFINDVIESSSKWWDTDFLMTTETSLFNNLNLTEVVQKVLEDTNVESTGLTVKGYHIFRQSKTDSSNYQYPYYNGEQLGDAEYTVTINTSGRSETMELGEILLSDGSAMITTKTRPAQGNQFPNYGNRNPNQQLFTVLVQNIAADMGISASSITSTSVECRWGMKDEGLLTFGLIDGVRRISRDDIIVKRV